MSEQEKDLQADIDYFYKSRRPPHYLTRLRLWTIFRYKRTYLNS